ncbi:MFS transporter [Paeniglutamicibacter kerguelensis]|uniref:MFS transporter n=1 Tax=Paeniglutamicibacter kerguelensis TaxID=254788 RepID=A0ABS4XFF2_9MICC|nr:MFS transporter [Paeniglutamicibacter kerguelensis]MBP2387179.1 putative MFS transporter [Paeniglutamicibacter kerguelensis]
MESVKQGLSVIERMENMRVASPHYKLAMIGGLGLLFDGMDGSLVSYVLPIITPLWNLTGGQTGLIGSSLLIGILIGALVAGVLGDRIGRRKVMMYALAFYAVATAIAAFSVNWEMFFALRVLAGIGLGAEAAIIPTFISELIPAAKRGLFVGSVAGFFSLGYLCAALIGTFVVAPMAQGWRIGQLVTALPVVLLLWWRRVLPESPRWLIAQGRVAEAEEIATNLENGKLAANRPTADATVVASARGQRSTTKLFRHAELFARDQLKRTIVLWVLWIAVTFSFYGFFVWIPSLLVANGMTITKSFTYTLIITIAQIPGYYSAAYLNEKLGRKVLIFTYLVGGVVSAFLLARSGDTSQVLVFGSMISFFMNGCYAGLYAYTPEVYPTNLRATGVGTASAVGRIGGIAAPIIIGVGYAQLGFGGIFAMIMAVLLAGALTILIFGVDTKGRTLEDISATRSAT